MELSPIWSSRRNEAPDHLHVAIANTAECRRVVFECAHVRDGQQYICKGRRQEEVQVLRLNLGLMSVEVVDRGHAKPQQQQEHPRFVKTRGVPSSWGGQFGATTLDQSHDWLSWSTVPCTKVPRTGVHGLRPINHNGPTSANGSSEANVVLAVRMRTPGLYVLTSII
jgi:hypothetical protein